MSVDESDAPPDERHPVRLQVTDDLHRTRLTVFFRLLLAIPHLIWLALWSIAAWIAAIIQWFVALATGKPADGLHDFLSRYVRYSLHVSAYVGLLANRYPAFNGKERWLGGSYDVNVTLPPAAPQPRLKTLLRIVLALPAALLNLFLGGTGFPFSWGTSRSGSARYSTGFRGGALLGACAFLGWFAGIVTGRMPKGLRDAGVYAAGYSVQLLAYLFFVTDRYPDADPEPMLQAVEAPPPHPVRVGGEDDLRRSRVTVLFRVLLVLPHLVWLLLWAIAIFFSSIANWLVAVFTGSPARPLHRFASAYVRYGFQVYAFLYLVANPFPGFAGGAYPLELELPPCGRQHRAVTLFRVFLVVPAFIVSAALSNALLAASVLMWFTGVLLGRVPSGLRKLGVYALRYNGQINAYLTLVTDRYPHASPLAPLAAAPQESEPWTQPPESLPAAG